MIGDGSLLKSEIVPIRTANDVVVVRQRVRALSLELRFGLVDQTKVVTAASELGRNTLEHGGGGEAELALVTSGVRSGIRLRFSDHGPGIADLNLALRDGYTSAKGMGLGLGGSKRLMHEFDIQSEPGRGTTVTVVRWK
ncbi:MAG: anti-sigma regulatory factor [Janthinobacterium lividum]